MIIARSAWAFNVLKYVGAAYLVYLGMRMLMRKDQPMVLDAVVSQGARRALFDGIAVEVLNIKTTLFFWPSCRSFIPSEPLVPRLVLLGCICVALNTFVDVLAVFAAHRLLKSGFARVARARLMTRVSGVTMLGLGAFLALAQREA